MSTVLVVLNFVISLHAEPRWDWAVLAGSLGQGDLCLEALLAWLFVEKEFGEILYGKHCVRNNTDCSE